MGYLTGSSSDGKLCASRPTRSPGRRPPWSSCPARCRRARLQADDPRKTFLRRDKVAKWAPRAAGGGMLQAGIISGSNGKPNPHRQGHFRTCGPRKKMLSISCSSSVIFHSSKGPLAEGALSACRKSLFAPGVQFSELKKFKKTADGTRRGLFAPFTPEGESAIRRGKRSWPGPPFPATLLRNSAYHVF